MVFDLQEYEDGWVELELRLNI